MQEAEVEKVKFAQANATLAAMSSCAAIAAAGGIPLPPHPVQAPSNDHPTGLSTATSPPRFNFAAAVAGVNKGHQW